MTSMILYRGRVFILIFTVLIVYSCAATPDAQRKPGFSARKESPKDSPLKRGHTKETAAKANIANEGLFDKSDRFVKSGKPEILAKGNMPEEAGAGTKNVHLVATVEIGGTIGGTKGPAGPAGGDGEKTKSGNALTEATLKLMNDNPAGALALFKPASAIEAGKWEFYYNSGLLYLKMGEVEMAQEEFLAASRYNAPPAKIYNALGTLYALNGKKDKAVESMNGSFMLERSFSAAMNLGTAHLGMGHAKEAEKFYLEAASLDSVNPLLHYNMGVMRSSGGDYAGAMAEFAAAIGYGRRDSHTLSAMAQALLRLNRYEEALKAFEEIKNAAPDDPLPFKNMGIIYEIYLGDMDKALENYTAYLEKGGADAKDVSAWIDVVKARISAKGKKDEN